MGLCITASSRMPAPGVVTSTTVGDGFRLPHAGASCNCKSALRVANHSPAATVYTQDGDDGRAAESNWLTPQARR